MKFKLSILSAAVLAAASLSVAQAQPGAGSTGPSTMPSTTATKGGERSTPNQDKGAMPRSSLETRAEVKAETAAAKAAASVPQGQQSTARQGKKPTKTHGSQNARADVKADAIAAKKAGTAPAGQESVKDQNKGGIKPPA